MPNESPEEKPPEGEEFPRLPEPDDEEPSYEEEHNDFSPPPRLLDQSTRPIIRNPTGRLNCDRALALLRGDLNHLRYDVIYILQCLNKPDLVKAKGSGILEKNDAFKFAVAEGLIEVIRKKRAKYYGIMWAGERVLSILTKTRRRY